MSSNSDDTILPLSRRPINSSGMDGDTVLPSQNAPGIHVPGDVIDNRYTVIREIGRGGMGVVYEVEDAVTTRRYAIKRLLPHMASIEKFVRAFVREGTAAEQFSTSSPHFVTTKTVGKDTCGFYVLMELVNLPTLRQVLRASGRLELNRAVAILTSLAIGLADLHKANLIHRDLKPENVFVDESKHAMTIRLVDFGLTREVTANSTIGLSGGGSLKYMAPEQFRDEPATMASDVYAFGVIAYEMLTGELPTYGDNIRDYVNDVPNNVVDLITECLTARPVRRPTDGNSLALALSESMAIRTIDRLKLEVDHPLISSKVNSPNVPLHRASAQSTFPELKKYIESMCKIPAGSFQMGSISGNSDEKPVHRVSVSSFYMGATPVTVAMWKEYCAATRVTLPPSPPWGWLDNHPIVNVSWDEIMGSDGVYGYCAWASEIAGGSLSLPTEAQWEYASRGGVAGKEFPWGSSFDDTKLWNASSTKRSQTAPVNRTSFIFRNGYGLTDMVGNVWEWCSDLYGLYGKGAQADPTGPPSSLDNLRCLRGGSAFYHDPSCFRCSNRSRIIPMYRNHFYGFRLVKESL